MSVNALEVARYLATHPRVSAVTYPGLDDAPHHDVATRLMQLVDSKEPRYGSLLSFEVADGDTATRNVFDRFEMIMRSPATSSGSASDSNILRTSSMIWRTRWEHRGL